MIFFWFMLTFSLAVLVPAALVIQHRARRFELPPATDPFQTRMRRALAAAEPPEPEMVDSARSDRSSLSHRRFRPPHLVSWSVSRVEPDRSGPEEETG